MDLKTWAGRSPVFGFIQNSDLWAWLSDHKCFVGNRTDTVSGKVNTLRKELQLPEKSASWTFVGDIVKDGERGYYCIYMPLYL